MDKNPPDRPGPYALADLFQIRMAGVPFDVLEPLATPRAVALAREIGAAGEAAEAAAGPALAVLRDPAAAAHPARDRLLRAIDRRAAVRALPPGSCAEVSAWADAAGRAEALRARYPEVVREELLAASRALRSAARRYLPGYSFFASATVEELVFDIGLDAAEGPAGWRDRQRDRTLLMYVQRLATKNETLSAFGPSAWGRVDAGARGLRLELSPGLRRHAFLERWVAQAVVSAMNADPAVRPELAPRLHPAARLEDGAVVRTDSGARLALDAGSRALLERCDGTTPARALGSPQALAALADAGGILWAAEVPAYVVDRMGALAALAGRWPPGEARSRWLPLLSALAEIPAAFEREAAPEARRELVQRARRLLSDVHASSAPAQRVLDRGSNPVSEGCVRACEAVLGVEHAREVTDGAAPWLDLWRDTVAFVADRANAKLRALHAAASGGRGGGVPLPAFLAVAEKAGLQMQLNGVPALGYLAFLEVKAAWREAMAKRPDAHAWTLSAEDCAFLRHRFEFPRFDAFTYPSADLQLAARSLADVEAGRHRWVVAELHLPAVMLQHGIYWGCPDAAAFDRAVRAAAGGSSCDWGVPGDITAHTMLHFDPLAELFTYAGPSVPPPRWRAIRPADAEVVVAEEGDVRLRARGEDLGSFARSWVPALGFHPFLLGCGAHTPRLEVGRVVVQRETWTIGRADLPRAPYAHGAVELVHDVDRLRAARGIPRHVYVRPTEEAVRRMGAGGRDKDVKPVYVDLESHPFLDVLARWMAKHGELEVAEMLPGPDELLLRDEEGRRTFELRTLVVPGRARRAAR